MSEVDESIDDVAKRPSSHGVMRLFRKKISSLTQQPSMNNAVKNPESPGRASINSIQKSVELNVPNEPRSPRSPVGEPTQLATQPNGTSHAFPFDNQDPQVNSQISPRAQSPSSDLPTDSPDANGVCAPNDFQLKQSDELQPASSAHQTQGMPASRLENISHGQNGLAMTLQEQVEVIDVLIAEKKSLSQQLEAERQQHQKDLAYWRNRASEAASKSANLVPGMPLSQPDTELRNEWRGLAYEVRNFVDNHFHKQNQRQKKSEEFTPLFHQWGALTANLIETLRTSDHHYQRVHPIVQELEDLFFACRSAGVMYKPDTYRRDLRALVTKAVRFDFCLSGQTAEYCVGWPEVPSQPGM
ncbi:hypothetical protein FGADI_10290 [Fusarium gaditjirri]|uniref:Uncharacterized protein n=1 Tax=Fusarium gaditjirri TaxID=282569 RepID=A0A8H4SY20_9HYPO|nr:hypothetical protein FGADI_10290 [Fusarium gaditjirri]